MALLLAGTFCLVFSGLARAEDVESLIRQGIELRRKGDDLRAEGYFKLAYKEAQTPRAAAQLGLVELALEKPFEANLYLTEALDSDDSWVQKSRKILEDSRGFARSKLGEVDVAGAPAGATVKAGAHAPIVVPDDGRIWLPAGETTLTIEGPRGLSEKRTVDVKVGVPVKVTMAPPPAPASLPAAVASPTQQSAPATETTLVSTQPREDSPGRSLRVAGIATGAVGIAAVVAGLVLRSMATSKYDAVANATTAHPFSDGDLDYKTYDQAGVATLVIGGVAVAAGVTMFVVGRREGSSGGASAPTESALDFGVGPRSFVVGGRF